MATTDLPTNINTGDPFYEMTEPLDMLQAELTSKNVTIDSLDTRGVSLDTVMYNGYEPRELQKITSFINENPQNNIRSSQVKDLNDYFDKNLDTSNPNYIFRTDLQTRNNIRTIRNGIQSYVASRDMFVTPPPLDTQQKILELLKKQK